MFRPEKWSIVKIVGEEDGRTHVYLDGEEIHHVCSVSFEQSVDCLPTVKLEINANIEIDQKSLVTKVYVEKCNNQAE